MTLRTVLGTTCLVALIGVAGCNQTSGEASGGGYCTPFPSAQSATPASPGANTGDPAAAFDDCVHRWSYALAPGRDGADIVAQAAVSACGTALSHWNEQTLNQNPDAAGQGAEGESGMSAQSLTTGQPTDMMGARAQYAQSRALFYVAQARAGHCAAPPAKSLPPPG